MLTLSYTQIFGALNLHVVQGSTTVGPFSEGENWRVRRDLEDFFFLERGRGVESVSPSSQMIRTKPSYPRAALNDQKVENTTNKVMCPGRAFSFRERSTTIFILDLSFVKGCENLSCISQWFTCSPWSPSVLRRQVGFHDARTSGQGGWSLLLP